MDLPPSPIHSLVQTMQALVDLSIRQPDRRAMIQMCLDGIVSATANLWHSPALERADYRRLHEEALRFYADGGADGGERARRVFAILEADRAEYWCSFPSQKPE
jgi:hypothetical protein